MFLVLCRCKIVYPLQFTQMVLITYVNDPILGAVSVGTADVQSGAISHRLYHSDVVPTVEVLEQTQAVY